MHPRHFKRPFYRQIASILFIFFGSNPAEKHRNASDAITCLSIKIPVWKLKVASSSSARILSGSWTTLQLSSIGHGLPSISSLYKYSSSAYRLWCILLHLDKLKVSFPPVTKNDRKSNRLLLIFSLKMRCPINRLSSRWSYSSYFKTMACFFKAVTYVVTLTSTLRAIVWRVYSLFIRVFVF